MISRPLARLAGLVCAAWALTGCGKDQAPGPLGATRPVAGPLVTPEAADPNPIVADVDLSQVRRSDVADRLASLARPHTREAITTALGAAVLDALALRELRVLGERPRPGESGAAAVDRLLPLVFHRHGCARVDGEALRLRFLAQLARFRHPRAHLVWEAHWRCCQGAACEGWSQQPTGNACRSAAMAGARRLAQALGALSLPAEVTPGTTLALEQSPCQARAIPAFEGALALHAPAADAGEPAPTLRRYSFYVRGDARFPESTFRRGDPALETALAKTGRICEAIGPVEVRDGVALVMRAGHLPAAWAERGDASVQAALEEELCQEAAIAERDAWLSRLGAKAQVRWRRPAIAASWGAEVEAAVQPWAGGAPASVLPPTP